MPLTVQKETDTHTEKSIYYDFIRLGDSSTLCNLLWAVLVAYIRAYLGTIWETLLHTFWCIILALAPFLVVQLVEHMFFTLACI